MKLKIKKANKFYLVENNTASPDSSVDTSNNDDIFAIKDTDSEFLQNFKEYCKSAINSAEQQTDENTTENTSTASDNTPIEGNQENVDNAIAGLAGLANDVVVDPSTGN